MRNTHVWKRLTHAAPAITLAIAMGLPILGTPAARAQAALPPAPASPVVPITLVAINDLHGHLEPPSGSVLVASSGEPEGRRVSAGGAAYLASLVQSIRRQNPGRTLLIGNGDLVGASPMVSSLFHDEPTIEVLNQMGLEVSSVGNHEFDKGSAELLRLQRGGCYPALADGSGGVVGRDTCMHAGQFAGARFQYLAANVIDTRTGQTLLPATAVREVAGIKLGFIGLTLRGTPAVVLPWGVRGLQFANEVATVNRLVPVLKKQGATVIVVLMHQGGHTSARTVQDKTCPDFRGPIVDVADRLDAAVDVVVSGHTHQAYVCVRPDGKLVTQAGAHGMLASRIELQVDAATGKLLSKDAHTLVVPNPMGVQDATGQTIALPAGLQALEPDAEVAAIVRRYTDWAAPLTQAVAGRLAEPLDRRANAAGESSLGAFVADGYLAATATDYAAPGQRPAHIAFTNPGGLRADLGTRTVTVGQLFNVLPFGNHLVTLDLTGAQVYRLLEQQWERGQPAGGRIMPVSQGFTYTWDARTPEGAAPGQGARVVPGSAKLHGVPLALEKTYRITVNNFMATGGDSLNVLKQGQKVQEGMGDLEAVTAYVRRKGLVPAPEAGRIQRLQ